MMQEDSNGDFEIVDKKMATLLTSEPSGGSNSVLTNVAPPLALPSFLASPIPASPSVSPPPAAGPISVPPGASLPYKPLEGNMQPPPGAPIPPVGPPLAAPMPTPGPPPGVPGISPPPPSVPPPSNIPPPSGVPPPTGAAAVTAGIPSPFPPTSPPSQAPIPAAVNMAPSQTVVTSPPAPPFVPSSSSTLPVTSHPQSPPSAGNVDASVDLGSPGVGGPPRPGWFGWIRGTVSNVGHKVAEKARSSMDTMITTLDPQMKEFIHSGGDMDIVVASDKEVKVGSIREAFQAVFGKATVVGMAAQSETVAAQPVGFAAALQSGEERINSLRSSGRVHPQQPVVSVENFIVELTPECWYDIGLLLLDDPGEDIILQTYTQVTPVPPTFVTQARAATQEDYPFKESGFAATVGQIASQSLQVQHTMWQESLTGVSRRDLIVLAARTLAGLYKSRLPRSL